MPVLQINQHPGGAPDHYRISVIAKEIPDRAALSFDTGIEFKLTRENGERIRWYLEDYLDRDEDPAPQIARGVEEFMAQCGEELFGKIFRGSDDAISLWSNLEPHLSSTRIEINTGIAEATAIPWELIRNPRSKTFLALSAVAFVRGQRGGQAVLPPAVEASKVRILLVICRPGRGEDVPFRSVAGKLVTRLSDEARDAFDIDVLRPPTYEQLAARLNRAKERGQPYHIVHFDGHGVYADPRNLAEAGTLLDSLKLHAGNAGAHGFLTFEDPDSDTNSKFVDGFRLGALLRDTGVPVLILNACQSASAEARPAPEMKKPGGTRAEVEAYGSLAQAVMDAGAAGVVAMRYSVYVVTAAQFVAELYGALGCGRGLGEAVTWARKNLNDQPDRQIAYAPRPLQDWPVPVVWERSPLRLWPEKPGAAPLKISLAGSAASNPGALDQALPARPDIGFYGRDETLYALDRAFDTRRIVLLHAYAGSGKTSTAAEFARWYALTGGVKGPVLFTSFERHLPLARVLDKIGIMFGPVLEGAGTQWDTITGLAQRRDIALQVLQQVPVLWIWDNVEPVTGFPAGTASDWSASEQQELRAFLKAARDTQAKFLLTSRREEFAWLGELALRVDVPDMPMHERLQLAGAIAAQRGKRLADLTRLLNFTCGNPQTILATVGEALRAGIDSKERLDAFVVALRNGQAAFEDEKTEGRSKSLGVSLSYGFGAAFAGDERKILALLHLFQGFLDVDTLRVMGNPGARWCLEAVRGLTRERGIALLDRAVEIGLLKGHGRGYYGVHPALPWYFRALFERYFPEADGKADGARCAFVEAMGQLGSLYHDRYGAGERELLSQLEAEEDNLLEAWRLARAGNMGRRVISAMQGLYVLYQATGRSAAWRRLVESVTPEFIDRATGHPLAGSEYEWRFITDYRVDLAGEERDWNEAERLLRVCLDWDRRRAEPILATKPETWNSRQRNTVRTLGVSLQHLSDLQLEQKKTASLEGFRAFLAISRSLGDIADEAAACHNLGRVYLSLPDLFDLDEAERWTRKAFDLRPPGDTFVRSGCLAQLGAVAYARFLGARKAGRPVDDLQAYLEQAAQLYEKALAMTPASAIQNRGIIHSQLGDIYKQSGLIDRALYHYREDIQYSEITGDAFGAGMSRYSVAVALLAAGRFSDAGLYAEAALENFQVVGDRAADNIRDTASLIARIKQIMKENGGM